MLDKVRERARVSKDVWDVIINFELTEGATVSFDLYSVNGERIATKLVGNNVSGAQFISWDLTSYNLASGMYIIKFNADEHTQTIKVIKQ